jgi:hypothetical protein
LGRRSPRSAFFRSLPPMILEDEESAPLLRKAAQVSAASEQIQLEDEEALIGVPPPPPYSCRPTGAAPVADESREPTHNKALARFLRALIVASIIWSICVIPLKYGFYVIASKIEKVRLVRLN